MKSGARERSSDRRELSAGYSRRSTSPRTDCSEFVLCRTTDFYTHSQSYISDADDVLTLFFLVIHFILSSVPGRAYDSSSR